MLRAYKYRIYPTDEQKILFAKTFGCCRFVYNWGLNVKKKTWETEKKCVSRFDLQKILSAQLKRENEWLKEINSQSLQSSLGDLEHAYKTFFSKRNGSPRYKSKHNKQSFQSPQHSSVNFDKGTLSIIKAKDIPCVFDRRFKGKIKTVTISMTPAGRYYASILVDTNIQELPTSEINSNTTIGIDMGIKDLAVVSDGRTIENQKNLQHSQKRLKMLQKRLSRKQKGSNNRNKARIKVARMHEHIANQRHDYLHKITHALTHDSQVRTICIEDLNVKGMTRNHHLAQAVNDASFGEFRRQLEYKCRWYGVNLIKINRFAPSSKTCSKCGYIKKDLKLSERYWMCPECGTRHDRDSNAALNIRNIGLNQALPSA